MKKTEEVQKMSRADAIIDFLAHMKDLDPEVREAELKSFSAVERENIKATEYIAADIYPGKKVNQKAFLLSLKFKGKTFYPIVGWDPDAPSPFTVSGLITPMRRWLNGKKKYKLHNSKEDRTYILYA